ncbi:hypothetical protein [Streptomyces sp. NBC_00670]|uniref:hypothetical protein n=1 Tax=Streptomyces sp. NBC_00670 TaxID=2975804 RepID=UPI002E33B791|nr:hypothetical protein [Streptomyces sp. NBC_00670]
MTDPITAFMLVVLLACVYVGVLAGVVLAVVAGTCLLLYIALRALLRRRRGASSRDAGDEPAGSAGEH